MPYRGPRRSDVDATTLRGKTLCGYQGWFRTPGDGTERGWFHWSRSRDAISPGTVNVEMWPEVGEWQWRGVVDPEWRRAFRRFAAYSPWDVGNVRPVDGRLVAAGPARWAEDLTEAKRTGMLLFPVIFPGFSWDNLTRKAPGTTLIPRRRGEFFREQFRAAADLGIGQTFVAMFDEVDEGTVIFKVTNTFPRHGHFTGLEGLPSDAYLKLASEGMRLIRQSSKGAR